MPVATESVSNGARETVAGGEFGLPTAQNRTIYWWIVATVRRLSRLVVVAGFALVAGLGWASAATVPTARDGLPALPADVPSVLSSNDQARYRHAFARQEAGDFAAADRDLAKLEDKTLAGWLLYQRFMHAGYRASYTELAGWLALYYDHPGAHQIYNLALQRQLKGQKPPRAPATPSLGLTGAGEAAYPAIARERSLTVKSSLRKIGGTVADPLRSGKPDVAEARLEKPEIKRALTPAEYDHLRWQIAAAFYFKGDDGAAFRIASSVAARARQAVPLADWTAGLAAWRLGKHEIARSHFEALAGSKSAAAWNVAAGAYWAARANLVTGRPEHVTIQLDAAAQHSFTFYGLIAGHLLGRNPTFDWALASLETPPARHLLSIKGVQRAIALRQVGQIAWAEQELRQIIPNLDAPYRVALAAIAGRLNLAFIEMRLSRSFGEDDDGVEASHYPIPAFMPEDGFHVDRALIYAFMREESGFNTNAKSRAGAYGLMQLMPRTASAMANDKTLGQSKKKLLAPDVNVELGQKYVAHLLEQDEVNGNLFFLTAAYNAGPGKVRKWQREVRHADDPLLFIESIPIAETRRFVQRVTSSLWIYRARLGQDSPGLIAIATGDWPHYIAQDLVPAAGPRAAPKR